MHNTNCFTYTSQGRARVLVTECELSETFDPTALQPLPASKSFEALWDTGATNSCISQKVVDDLGLKPTGVAKVHGVAGESIVNTYIVAVVLPNAIRLPALKVTLGNLGSYGMLIGMDIISLGDFSVTNAHGNTMFSFRMPGMVHTDYLSEQKNAMKVETLRLKMEAEDLARNVDRIAKAEAKRLRKSARNSNGKTQ